MVEGPLVSIIIPTYNREKFLPRSINSALSQTYSNLDLIIVDDRSTDNTEQLVKSLIEKDKRIRYIKNTHGHSCAGARNQGIEAARGDFIALLDSDDEWYEHHLEEAMYYLTKYPDRIDLVTAKLIKKRRPDEVGVMHGQFDINKFKHCSLEKAFILDVETLFDSALRYGLGSHEVFVGKAKIFKTMMYDESIFIEDAFLSRQLAYNKVKIAYIPEYHAVYWLHDSNSVNVAGNKSLHEQIRLNNEDVKLQKKILETFPLTRKQKAIVSNRLADIYFWGLGYIYLHALDREHAKECFMKGIAVRPFNLSYWKTFILRIVLRYNKI